MCFNMLIAAAKVFWPETAAALDVRVRSLDTGGLLQSTTVVQLLYVVSSQKLHW